jgi:hypothetical protein
VGIIVPLLCRLATNNTADHFYSQRYRGQGSYAKVSLITSNPKVFVVASSHFANTL